MTNIELIYFNSSSIKSIFKIDLKNILINIYPLENNSNDILSANINVYSNNYISFNNYKASRRINFKKY